MKFIHTVNFKNAPANIRNKLDRQLRSDARTVTRWVEWTEKIQCLIAHPDVTLVYAANLSWRSLKMIADETKQNQIVLYGCHKPILGLPLLYDIDRIDGLSDYLHEFESAVCITSEHLPRKSDEYVSWKHTVPVCLEFKA